MAISIRNSEVEVLARDLAKRAGTSMTDEILEALKERKARLDGDAQARYARIRAIVERVDKLPVLDNRTPDEIIGYNEFGGFD